MKIFLGWNYITVSQNLPYNKEKDRYFFKIERKYCLVLLHIRNLDESWDFLFLRETVIGIEKLFVF